MSTKANLRVAVAVVVLACAVTSAQVAAQTVTVTPANPTVSVGQAQQFTAAGVGGATAVDLRAFFRCALIPDGSVRCLGSDDSRPLRDGTTTNSSKPVT